MKYIVLAGLFCVFAIYFAKSCVKVENKATPEKILKDADEHKAAELAADLEARTNASSGWIDSLLGGQSFRASPVLTVELESFWKTGRPILFGGELVDVSTSSDSEYVVTVRRNVLYSRAFIKPKLQVSLLAKKGMVDNFLERNPELSKGLGLNKGVAVVGVIQNVRTISTQDSDGNSVDIRVGDGELIDIVFTGNLKL